jgi:hypothetical protein
MKLFAPPGAPAWFNDVLLQIERGFREQNSFPVRLQEFANSAVLPEPSNWRAGIIYVTSITMVAVSDGTNWRRLDTGAIL